MGVSQFRLLPRYDVHVQYEPRACFDTIVPIAGTVPTQCHASQKLLFAQSLDGEVYALCSCDASKRRGTSLGTFPLLPEVPDPIEPDEEDEEQERKENNGAIPIPDEIPEGVYL